MEVMKHKIFLLPRYLFPFSLSLTYLIHSSELHSAYRFSFSVEMKRKKYELQDQEDLFTEGSANRSEINSSFQGIHNFALCKNGK